MNKLILSTAIATALLAAGSAYAAEKSASFQVSATVTDNCTVATNNLNLGDFRGDNDLTATADVEVRCSAATDYTVALSQGSGTFAARELSGSGGTLAYNLYADAGHNTVWGDGTGGTVAAEGVGGGMTLPVAHTVYGRLLAADNGNAVIEAGNYSDTIVATVTY